MTTIVSQLVEGCGRFDKKHVELVNLSFTIMQGSSLESSKFLSTSVPLTPHQIGISQELILISNIPHASKVFTTPIVTFENTLD
jgi:hypothetical protein